MNHDFLQIEGLSKKFVVERDFFGKTKKVLTALDNVSFSVDKGKTLGIVGESGCGKSTLGRCVLRLLEPSEGKVFYKGQDVTKASREEVKHLRRKMQIIFQDPYSSLNPRMTVFELIKEPLDNYEIGRAEERKKRVYDMMEEVSLRPSYAHRYPHEFSGGQRQRITIARALILEPDFVVCDEPVSALDVSVQSQVLNLMKTLQRDKALTYLFISHNLSVVKYMSDEIAVMYLGKIVEKTTGERLFERTLHPYSQALIAAIPVTVNNKNEKIGIKGEVPSAIHMPSGCRYHTRCPYSTELCREEEPLLNEVEAGHFVACHRYRMKEKATHV